MKCRFCSGQAETFCQFTLSEPRINFPPELAVGDLVQSTIDLGYGMIEKISGPHHDSGMGPYFLAKVSGRRHKRPEFLNARLPVLVVRHEPCGTPVCDAHYINRGDEKAVCPYHWEIKEVEREPDAIPKPAPVEQPGPEAAAAAGARPATKRKNPPAVRPAANAKRRAGRPHLVR